MSDFSRGDGKPGLRMQERVRQFFCRACHRTVTTTSRTQKYCQTAACLAVRDRARPSQKRKPKAQP